MKKKKKACRIFTEWMLSFRLRIRTFQRCEVLKLVADTSIRHQNSQNSSVIAYNLCGETDEYDHTVKRRLKTRGECHGGTMLGRVVHSRTL